MVPTDELPPPAGGDDDDSDMIPTESLPPIRPTEAPTLAGSVAAQTVNAGQTLTVNVTSNFGGIVQSWTIVSSNPSSLEVSMTDAGEAVLRGVAAGTATVTVTAVNDIGSVAQAFTVTVGAASATTTMARTGSGGILTLVGNDPSLSVSVGSSVTLDISSYFSAAAITFNYSNANDPNGLINVAQNGSILTITGIRAGTVTITITASTTNTTSNRPATIRVS